MSSSAILVRPRQKSPRHVHGEIAVFEVAVRDAGLRWIPEMHRAIEAGARGEFYDVVNLARDFGVTRRGLHRRFKKYGAEGPHRWLMAGKLIYALWCYWKTQITLGELSTRMGYPDGQTGFSSHCKRATGLGVRQCIDLTRWHGSLLPVAALVVADYLIA